MKRQAKNKEIESLEFIIKGLQSNIESFKRTEKMNEAIKESMSNTIENQKIIIKLLKGDNNVHSELIFSTLIEHRTGKIKGNFELKKYILN